jgi:phosphopentomutase
VQNTQAIGLRLRKRERPMSWIYDIARVILIVLDGVGIGQAPDAALYGDEGANTLSNTALAVGGLHIPNLESMGLGNITPILGVKPVDNPLGSFGKMQARSKGKDTITGHWEMAGIILDKPFPTYPKGFPSSILAELEKRTNHRFIGNKPASGTEIIQELGESHIKNKELIIYTSADSVCQIAAHEEIIPLEELYQVCQTARQVFSGEHAVGRIIARPFRGKEGEFFRTVGRRDFSLPPMGETILDRLTATGKKVYSVGKVAEIFADRGISRSFPAKSNQASMDVTLDLMQNALEVSLIFANLVEFDMVYGHRNNPQGFAQALTQFDQFLPKLLNALTPKDLLIITADHGCDPIFPSTDHTREFVPVLTYTEADPRINLNTRESFSDIAATITQIFNLPEMPTGVPLFGSKEG